MLRPTREPTPDEFERVALRALPGALDVNESQRVTDPEVEEGHVDEEAEWREARIEHV